MGKMDWELWISRCKLLYTEWINNKGPTVQHRELCSYSMINQNGKEYEKECVCIYIYV